MEIPAFADAIVGGVPLLFVVIGLVQWIKSFGVQGNALRLASMGVGLILGIGYMLASQGVPPAFGGWFAVIVYGLGLGIVASGVYDAAKSALGLGL